MRQMNILIQVGAMLVVHPDNNIGACVCVCVCVVAFETTEKIHTLEFPGWLGQVLFIKDLEKKNRQ